MKTKISVTAIVCVLSTVALAQMGGGAGTEGGVPPASGADVPGNAQPRQHDDNVNGSNYTNYPSSAYNHTNSWPDTNTWSQGSTNGYAGSATNGWSDAGTNTWAGPNTTNSSDNVYQPTNTHHWWQFWKH